MLSRVIVVQQLTGSACRPQPEVVVLWAGARHGLVKPQRVGIGPVPSTATARLKTVAASSAFGMLGSVENVAGHPSRTGKEVPAAPKISHLLARVPAQAVRFLRSSDSAAWRSRVFAAIAANLKRSPNR